MSIQFPNHPQVNMNREIHDQPTQLKSTRKIELSGIHDRIFEFEDH